MMNNRTKAILVLLAAAAAYICINKHVQNDKTQQNTNIIATQQYTAAPADISATIVASTPGADRYTIETTGGIEEGYTPSFDEFKDVYKYAVEDVSSKFDDTCFLGYKMLIFDCYSILQELKQNQPQNSDINKYEGMLVQVINENWERAVLSGSRFLTHLRKKGDSNEAANVEELIKTINTEYRTKFMQKP